MELFLIIRLGTDRLWAITIYYWKEMHQRTLSWYLKIIGLSLMRPQGWEPVSINLITARLFLLELVSESIYLTKQVLTLLLSTAFLLHMKQRTIIFIIVSVFMGQLVKKKR